MFWRNVLLSSLALLPLSLSAHIAGYYKVSGYNGETDQHYTGHIVIEKQDGSYTAIWNFSNGSFDIGTGVKEGNELAFVFHATDTQRDGVQLYTLKEGHLKGPWIHFGSTKKGYEKLTKLHD